MKTATGKCNNELAEMTEVHIRYMNIIQARDKIRLDILNDCRALGLSGKESIKVMTENPTMMEMDKLIVNLIAQSCEPIYPESSPSFHDRLRVFQ